MLILVSVYAVINAAIRRLAGSSLSMDDAKTNLFTQVWQWGYQPDNPPLFEWLIILLKPLVGGGFWAFLVLKYLSLVVAAIFLFRLARRLSNERVAFITTVGAVLLYQIGWNFHQAFTHSAILVPAVCAGMWALVYAVQSPNWRSAATLGLIVGIGLLTKYNIALFWAGAISACAFFRETRRAIFAPKMIVVPMIAGAILAPHLIWFLEQRETYHASVMGKLGVTEASSHLARVGDGLTSLVVAVASFFIPFVFVAGRGLRQQRLRLFDLEAYLVASGMGALVVLCVAVSAFGISDVSERYLIPVFLPVYVGVVVSLLESRPKAGALILVASGVMAILVPSLRLLTYASPGAPFCSACREFVPYTALQLPIEEMIPDGAVLIVREENTGGNLVEMFPNSPVRVFTSMHLTNPINVERAPCFMVWSKDMVDPNLPLDPAIVYMENDPSTVLVTGNWRHPFRQEGWRTTTWGITPILKKDLYRSFCEPNG